MSRARQVANLSPTIADARMPNLTGDVTTVEGAVATTIATDAVDIAMLSATGTASSSTFLRGDNAWEAAPSGLYESIAIVCQQESYNTDSGTFTSGAARIRTLNTELSDADGIVSLSSNQFTLGAGTYTIEWNAPAHSVDMNASYLYNVTDVGIVMWSQFGSANKFNDATAQHNSIGWVVDTFSGTKAFEIRHRCQTTHATNGFGLPGTHAGDGAFTGKYTVVKILKHA